MMVNVPLDGNKVLYGEAYYARVRPRIESNAIVDVDPRERWTHARLEIADEKIREEHRAWEK